MSFIKELSRQLDFWGMKETDEEFIDDDDEGEIDHLSICAENDSQSLSDDYNFNPKDEEDDEKEFYLGRDGLTKWRKFCCKFEKKSENPVTILSEVRQTAKGVPKPLDAWKLFIDDRMLKDVLKYTNTKICLKTAYYDADRQYQVGQTTIPELKAALGLLYFAGIYCSENQSLEDLWNSNGTGIEIFRLTMSFFRFTFLISFISFDDFDKREERKKTDKLAPIRDVFQRFVKNCYSSFTPSGHLSVYKRLEKFQGPCPFRQFMPKTPAKGGIEFFTLLDAKLCYVLNMEIYCGSEDSDRIGNEYSNILDRLVAPVSQSGRIVAIDESLTSYELMLDLLKNHKLTSVGRVGKNRKEIPDCFYRLRNEENKSFISGFQEQISVASYVDDDKKKSVILSTLNRDSLSNVNGIPEAIDFHDYTKKSNELFNELSSNCDVSRNTRRWPLAIFFKMLNVAGINSQIIYKMNKNDDKKRRVYLQELAHELVREHLQNRKKNQRIPREIRQKIEKYFGDPVEVYRKRRNVHGRCALCPREKDRKSFYGCAGCHRYICLEHAVFYCEDCCGVCEDD